MTDTLKQRAERVAELALAADRGPWSCDRHDSPDATWEVWALDGGDFDQFVADARRGERSAGNGHFIAHAHDMAALIADQAARIAELEVSHARYEYVRRLIPDMFLDLFRENISIGVPFDVLVDQRIATPEQEPFSE